MQANPARLVFVDETLGRWTVQTFISCLHYHELVTLFVINGTLDDDIFETYVRTELAPTFNKRAVVIWDSLNVHQNTAAYKAIRDRGAWLLFLPRYSPELNPIERPCPNSKLGCERLMLIKATGYVT